MSYKRYERKFLLSNPISHQIEARLKLHPFAFSEIYYERPVNNIYFDNKTLDNYQDNLFGSQNRLKIRARWYSDLKIVQNPKLEFKIKTGLLGEKESLDLSDFQITKNIPSITSLIKDDNKSSLLYKLKTQNIIPVLLNTYKRKYFQSFDQKFRITIDKDLYFYQILGNQIQWNSRLNINCTIMELKYDEKYDDIADKVSSFFPFRMTKSSKYILGMSKIYPQIKL